VSGLRGMKIQRMGNDQEIEFQEIKTHVFHEIATFAKLIRRLKGPTY
jgi:hypothetical protein